MVRALTIRNDRIEKNTTEVSENERFFGRGTAGGGEGVAIVREQLLIMVLRCRWPPNECDDDSEALCGSSPRTVSRGGGGGAE